MFITNKLTLAASGAMALLFVMSGCQQTPAESVEDAPLAASTAEEADTVSILRPEIELPDSAPGADQLEPYRATIGFPEGGRTLDADAVAALETALASSQMELGLAITLGSHSDSSGTDTANLNASEKRGLAVAQWLIDKGVDADRITVIAFGEQNPAQPNALPNGVPNEEGRAANRRVEIEIAVPASKEEQPTLPEPSNSKNSVEAGD